MRVKLSKGQGGQMKRTTKEKENQAMGEKHYCVVIETEKVVKTLGPQGERTIDKIDSGVNRNLNHEARQGDE